MWAWIFPSSLVLGACWLLVFPAYISLTVAKDIAVLDSAERGGLFVFTAVALGLVLSSISTTLYRLLEGYTWPEGLRKWGVYRQKARKYKIQARVKEKEGWSQGLVLEKLRRFPIDESEIAPTKLGNALRAFETYGVDRFGMDSQTLWTELYAVVPQSLQLEIDRARSLVDFFVALVYLTLGFAVVSFIGGLIEPDLKIRCWASGLIALFLAMAWYDFAVLSTSYWHTTVQALVNIGRTKLAEAMGLQLPSSLEEERRMWSLVTQFVYYGYDSDRDTQLDEFRAKSEVKP